MRTILKNGTVINVFTGEAVKSDILIEDSIIIGTGCYDGRAADIIRDLSGQYICPGFIDGHLHIESTMLTPAEFVRTVLPHGTTAVVADPHEIANVGGSDGLRYMLEASEGLPLSLYFVLPSCVPATRFDENGAALSAHDLEPFYAHPRVLGLGEVMSYPDVIVRNPDIMDKIEAAKKHGGIINGHAPLLTGNELDSYISAGIGDDHECSFLEEAEERIRKGQRVMIRQGTAAQNLFALLPLFDEPWASRCLLVTDDKHPADLLRRGHIDDIIRQAARYGKNPITGIRMATLWAAEHFGLRNIGAVAPGYIADLLVLDDLQTVSVRDVYRHGIRIVDNHRIIPGHIPPVEAKVNQSIRHSFHMGELTASSFRIDSDEKCDCTIIELQKGELITDIGSACLDFSRHNGTDIGRDILKISAVERHHATGHIGIGFIRGTGLKSGAIASSVSHDSHNLIIIGTSDAEMAAAGNRVRELEGGLVVVNNGQVIAEMSLPIAGLMSEYSAQETALQNEFVREATHALGVPSDLELFMTMAFISLPVIPHIKITTEGLVDVNRHEYIPLFQKAERGLNDKLRL